MSSDDSDDEPLSVLAASKKLHPEHFPKQILDDIDDAPKKKKKKLLPPKKFGVTIKINKNKHPVNPPVKDRPSDVWLYLKDLNPTGPYSCLLCSEWFINRPKMIIHYVLNHKKDFCGICRYFVPDRETWLKHLQFHSPWPCSQCVENFPTDTELRDHLSNAHKLVHCRLCHFRLPDDDQYNTHLFQKHNITNVSSKNEEKFWELECEGSPEFLCILCSKSNNAGHLFFSHYMGHHHFTLKCFSRLISGTDPPFSVVGADLSTQFIVSLKSHSEFGYVDLDRKPLINPESEEIISDGSALLKTLLPEIKEEINSETDENEELTQNNVETIMNDEQSEINKEQEERIKNYDGDEDFDVTLMELIMLQQCYFNYVSQALTDINSNIMPHNSDIDYENAKSDIIMDIDCGLCKIQYTTVHSFLGHMSKMHCVKSVPIYSCRVCATTFDSQNELDLHISQEMGDFDDLWMCQFCDKEFENRQTVRKHLSNHWDLIEYDNCYSPHIGFKCKYCPTLFWNEMDRETHQARVHFDKHVDQYYKCENCNDIFSDKIWFVHHYLEKHNEDGKVPLYLLKCCICCLVLETVEDMREHFSTEHPEARKVYCSLDSCKYKPLSHRKSFKLHLKTVHNPVHRVEKPMNCIICAREFSSSRACSTHMAHVHGPGKFKCKLCKEALHTNDERKLHYLISHPGCHPFECNVCGKSFQYKSSLYMHKQDHQPNKQSYTCKFCGKVFVKRDSFREHVQIHEGPQHACSYCPMRFVQRSNMLRHERRHTGERPYTCPHCARTFADKGACTSHIRTHQRTTPFTCLYCGQTFVQKSKLTYHIRKHTGENLETCTVCSKMFTSACSLREHMRIHERRKESVKCPLCERTYQDERYMLRHLRTMHTRSDFPCPICEKILTSAAGLRHHIVTHSVMKTFRCNICPKEYSVKRTMVKHLRRRHGIKGTELNIKDFYRRLDPRECQLGLDDDMMEKIFGPPKKATNDILIADYVTIANKSQVDKQKTETSQHSESERERSVPQESDEDSNSEEKEDKDIKDDSECSSAEELEPTDFVSVKIEPIDEEEM